MGIGHHVDHQIAAQVAVRMAATGALADVLRRFPVRRRSPYWSRRPRRSARGAGPPAPGASQRLRGAGRRRRQDGPVAPLRQPGDGAVWRRRRHARPHCRIFARQIAQRVLLAGATDCTPNPHGGIDMSNSTMALEARSAPQVLRSEAARWQREAGEIRRQVAGRPLAVLVGRGSSGNVCTFASYLFALQTGRQPIEFRPWLTTQPLPDADWSDAVVYAFSYLGQVHRHRRLSRMAACARCVWWWRLPRQDSANAHLFKPAHHIIRLGCGPERAVPATKSVIAQLFMAAALAGFDSRSQPPSEMADCMLRIDADGVPTKLADFLVGARTVTWLARGPSYGGALDAALKMQESVGMPSCGYSTAEYLHGPIASANPEDRVVLFSGAIDPMDSKQAVTTALLARGVPFLCLGSRPNARSASAAAVSRGTMGAYRIAGLHRATRLCRSRRALWHQSRRASVAAQGHDDALILLCHK